MIYWTSSYSETGVLGEAELATAEKGRQAYEEAVKQLSRFIHYWKDRAKDVRTRPASPGPDHADAVGPAAGTLIPGGPAWTETFGNIKTIPISLSRSRISV